MSALAIALTAIEATGLVVLESLLGTGARRGIIWSSEGSASGSLVPQVTIEENHFDDLTITEHPVERGAVIADHAYKRPALLRIKAGWSTAGQFAGRSEGLSTLLSTAALIPQFGDPNYLRGLYDQLLRLQADRTLVAVNTGKRSYTDMLIQSLALTTEAKTENALIVNMLFRQVILTQTATVTVPPAAVHADPARTAATVNNGTKQPLPAPGLFPDVP